MKYTARKLFTLLATMLIVSFLAFFAFSLVSGDAATAQLGTQATAESLAALRAELGLDRPLPVRYADWLLSTLHGDFGVSQHYQMPVSSLLAPRLPVTLCLSVMSFLMIVLVSIPLGVRSVRREGQPGKGRRAAAAFRTTANQLLMAFPPFFSSILISWIFGILLHWFQPQGEFPDFSAHPGLFFWYLLFPAVSIAIPRTAMAVRMLRSTLLREMNRDYVRTAISRGNDRQGVLYRHVLKNALPPVVAFLAQTMAEVIAGSIVIEQVFGVPGLGRLLLGSIGYRDWTVVEAIILILALWVVLANTAGDWIAQRIDPRLRLGGGEA